MIRPVFVKTFMPLSVAGLWDAVIIMPSTALNARTACWQEGVLEMPMGMHLFPISEYSVLYSFSELGLGSYPNAALPDGKSFMRAEPIECTNSGVTTCCALPRMPDTLISGSMGLRI